MFKKKKEVFLTNNAELYGRVCSALKGKDIPYETKTVNSGTQSRKSGELWGRIGENTNLEIMYYIYVLPENEAAAKYAIAEFQRGNAR